MKILEDTMKKTPANGSEGKGAKYEPVTLRHVTLHDIELNGTDTNHSSNVRHRVKKGDLDEEEATILSYDDDEKLDVRDIKQLVHGLRNKQKSESRWIRYSQLAAILLFFSVVCNFAMAWVTLALSRNQSQNDHPVKAHGEHHEVHTNSDYGRHLAEFKARHLLREPTEEEQEEFRALMAVTPVASATCQEVHDMFDGIVGGTTEVVTVDIDSVIYTGVVGSGVTKTTVDGCEDFDNIVEDGTTEPVYKVKCCCDASEYCDIYDLSGRRRQLCFAPDTEVDVQGKGSIQMQDLQPGDKVLAANGKYQDFFTFNHYSKTVKAPFLQLVTSKTTLELTDHHMVYLYGKSDPVPASFVKVGDALVGREQEPLEVIKIKEVTRTGFVNGQTVDGTIVANGVLASTHASHFGSQEYLIEGWGFKFIHAASFEHFVDRPFRRLCLEFGSLDFCNKFDRKDADADITRNIYDRIGYVWRDGICKKYKLPDAIHNIVLVMFVLFFNFLATPSLLIGLLVWYLSRKTGRMVTFNVRCHQKKIKSL